MNDERYVAEDDIDELMLNLAWLEALAVCLIVIGFTDMYAPFYSSFSIENITGASYLIASAMFIAHAFESRKWGRFDAEITLGSLYIVCAVLLLAHPFGVRFALTVYLPIFLALKGIMKFVYADRLRENQSRQWVLAGAVVSLLMAIVTGFWVPEDATWMIGVLVGLDLVFSGLSTMMTCHLARASLSAGLPFCFGKTCFTG